MKTASLVLALVLLFELPASAEYAAAIQACSQDAITVCSGNQSDQNRFSECVKLHFPDLSERCKASLVRIATVLKACATDIQEQCHLIKPGAGRIFLCVKQHFSALSEPCKEAIGKQLSSNKFTQSRQSNLQAETPPPADNECEITCMSCGGPLSSRACLLFGRFIGGTYTGH